jgi:hypothetical protein
VFRIKLFKLSLRSKSAQRLSLAPSVELLASKEESSRSLSLLQFGEVEGCFRCSRFSQLASTGDYSSTLAILSPPPKHLPTSSHVLPRPLDFPLLFIYLPPFLASKMTDTLEDECWVCGKVTSNRCSKCDAAEPGLAVFHVRLAVNAW